MLFAWLNLLGALPDNEGYIVNFTMYSSNFVKLNMRTKWNLIFVKLSFFPMENNHFKSAFGWFEKKKKNKHLHFYTL